MVGLLVACLAAPKVVKTARYLAAPKVASRVGSSAVQKVGCSADWMVAHWAEHWVVSLVACSAAPKVEPTADYLAALTAA